jgi:hypothetical protein
VQSDGHQAQRLPAIAEKENGLPMTRLEKVSDTVYLGKV